MNDREYYRDAEGRAWLTVHLWDFDSVECAMCRVVTRHRFAVPWYCGPVAEGDSEGGYKCVCELCHDRWAAWNEPILAARAEYDSWGAASIGASLEAPPRAAQE